MPHRQSHIGLHNPDACKIGRCVRHKRHQSAEQNRTENQGRPIRLPQQNHHIANSHRSTKWRRRGLITPPQKVSCLGAKRTCLWYPHRWLQLSIPYRLFYKDMMSQHMRHNINKKVLNVHVEPNQIINMMLPKEGNSIYRSTKMDKVLCTKNKFKRLQNMKFGISRPNQSKIRI